MGARELLLKGGGVQGPQGGRGAGWGAGRQGGQGGRLDAGTGLVNGSGGPMGGRVGWSRQGGRKVYIMARKDVCVMIRVVKNTLPRACDRKVGPKNWGRLEKCVSGLEKSVKVLKKIKSII